jgi:hypothetical protein
MSALGFVKEQRVPTHIRGEDEVFQKELQAIRGKLAAKPGQSDSACQRASGKTAPLEQELMSQLDA